MPSSETKPAKPDHDLIDEIEIRDLSSVRQYSSGGQGGNLVTPGAMTRVGGQNIVTVEIPKEQLVHQFEPGRIHDTKGVRYSDVTKGIKSDTSKQDRNFRVNALTRGPLSIEAEEEERIEAEVQRRLTERLAQLREEVTQEAHRTGFEAGRADGRQEVLQQLRPKLDQFEVLVAKFEGMRGEIFKANEELLVHIVNQITRAVVLRELKDDKGYVQRIATHLLERLGTRENIKIFVAEEELSAAEALKEGLAQNLGQLKNISIEADPAVKQGGCRVETEFGEVDGRIETQLQSIMAGLGVAPQP